MQRLLPGALIVFAVACAWVLPVAGQGQSPPPAPASGPIFSSSGQLARPADYREWIFLSSGLGMTYGPAQPASDRPPLFDNVFALYSGLVFLVIAGIVLAPVLHRVLHRFHWDERE